MVNETDDDDHNCAENFSHDQSADMAGDCRYEKGHCSVCDRKLQMVWKRVGIRDADSGEYIEEASDE